MIEPDVARQREYYARTAEHYETAHIDKHDEHGIALSVFGGFARLYDVKSVLDVGAGTGRALVRLQVDMGPDAVLVGVEPVAELRGIGHAAGIPDTMLIDGDALKLDFPDNSFDFVIETGVLHHIAEPARAVAEMVRVARLGVMISDCNNYGQGSAPIRLVKRIIAGLGLWRLFTFVTNGGKMAKWSEGDGVFYSYSVFDNIRQVRGKFPRIHYLNTQWMHGTDLKSGTGQVALIAMKA